MDKSIIVNNKISGRSFKDAAHHCGWKPEGVIDWYLENRVHIVSIILTCNNSILKKVTQKNHLFSQVTLLNADTMAGGTCMYIHSYQMHNVLNVYRKQLSQGAVRGISGKAAKSHIARDRINISNDGQRQSLFDKISSEIVERITRFGPGTEFKGVPADQLTQSGGGETRKHANSETDGGAKNDLPFTYTLIDEHNQKITQRLPAGQLSLFNEDLKSTIGGGKDSDINSDSE